MKATRYLIIVRVNRNCRVRIATQICTDTRDGQFLAVTRSRILIIQPPSNALRILNEAWRILNLESSSGLFEMMLLSDGFIKYVESICNYFEEIYEYLMTKINFDIYGKTYISL